MNFGSPFNPTAIWSVTTRALTGLGTAISTGVGGDNTALANGSTAGFQAGAGTMALRTVVGIAAANVTWNIGLFNGTTFRSGTSGASAAQLMFHGACSTAVGLAINNSGTVSGNYTTSAVVWNS